jgi:hypothetical protein
MPCSSPANLATHFLLLAGVLPLPIAAQQTVQSARQRDVISREEIDAVNVEDAYQVVLRLRPEFLHRARQQGSAGSSANDEDFEERIARRDEVSAAPSFSSRSRSAPDPNAPEFDREGAQGAGSSGVQAPAGGGGFAGSVAQGGGRVAAGVWRGARSSVVVYVGNMLLGGIEELTTLPAVSLQEIRFLSHSEAQFKFGPRVGGAVILVTMK